MKTCRKCIFGDVSAASYYPKTEYRCNLHYNYHKITDDKTFCFDYGCKDYKAKKEFENEYF